MDFRKARGNLGERLAKEYLKKKGLRFVRANFASRLGEVDLVFRDSATFIFVEVKLRTGHEYWPHEAVTKTKQRKLIRTAEIYLQRHGLLDHVDWRFDVVEIILEHKTAKIRHLENVIEYA